MTPWDPLPDGVAPDTDLANAHRIVRSDELRHAAGVGWLAWDGSRWCHESDDGLLRRAAQSMVQLSVDAEERGAVARRDWARRSQAIGKLRAAVCLARTLATTPVEELDRDSLTLGVANGCVDLRSGHLREPSRAALMTKRTLTAYRPDARAPTWDAFLYRVLRGDPELVNYVQRAIGYSLTGDTSEQVFFVLHGPGANGKSTLLEVLGRVLGDYAATASADVLMRSSGRGRGAENDVARLCGSRLVAASESGEGRRLDEERVKRLTGGDTYTARFLFAEFFEFKPQFKLWLCTNNRPEIRDSSHAMWRRVVLIPFATTIPAAERDRNLVDKLLAESEGILRWAVEGATKWAATGLGDLPSAVERAVADYREDEDAFGRFLGEACQLGVGCSAMATELYVAFDQWRKKNGEPPMSSKAIGGRLRNDDENRFRRKHTREGARWMGICPR